MTRLVWLAFLCLGASTSRAEGMLPGGAEISFAELLIHEDKTSASFAQPSTPEAQEQYFNMAHCVCSQLDYDGSTLPDFYAGHYGYKLTINGGDGMTVIDRPIEIWTGASCNVDQQTRTTNCLHTMTSAGTVAQIQTAGEKIIEIPLYDLMVPVMRMGCVEQDAQMGTTWALVDSEGDGTLDYSASAVVTTDTKAPPLPTNFRAVGAENAIKLEWDPPDGSADIAYYQALCATTLGGSTAKSDPPAPRYLTERQLCNASADAFLTPSDISSNTGTDAGTGSIVLTEDMAQLNPAYICGESTATSREMRINGLKNGVEYTVILLTIDKAGNARGTYFTSSLVPVPATDFWEDLQDQGSGVEGGFCLIAQAYGDGNPLTQTLRSFRDHTLADSAFGRWLVDVYYGTVGSLDLHGSLALRIVVGFVLLPFVVLALLWHALTLPGLIALVVFGVLVRRRMLRLRRFAVAVTMLAVFVLAPTRADAQVPYWEENDFASGQQELAPGDPLRVNWHAGVRIGPYVPGIDAQIDKPVGKYAGPYEQMFGGYAIMPVLDVERFFLHNPGQLGVGISIGYMGKKERAWLAGSMPTDNPRPRAEGDENKFRLIPMSLSGVFRLTYLDDNFGIPVIPYARAGLAYYVWWITAPNGDFAKACQDGGMTSGCMQTKARGASLGFVGSIGLAVRAERIDEGAARSMRESGLEHAGFYAEYSLGKVDGFGSDTKLSVGDATWFAGVDFEF